MDDQFLNCSRKWSKQDSTLIITIPILITLGFLSIGDNSGIQMKGILL